MIYLDGLPESLTVHGMEYPINSDFRAVLRYDRLINMEDEETAILRALETLYVNVPYQYIGEAIDAACWFVACGKEEDGRKRPSNHILGVNSRRYFDFETDDIRLWTAVKARYGIDLLTVDSLHWWLFRGMVDDIGEDSVLSRIMYYRTVDYNAAEMPKQRRDFLRALQNYYEITDYTQERDEAFIQALLNGEDITPFLEKEE